MIVSNLLLLFLVLSNSPISTDGFAAIHPCLPRDAMNGDHNVGRKITFVEANLMHGPIESENGRYKSSKQRKSNTHSLASVLTTCLVCANVLMPLSPIPILHSNVAQAAESRVLAEIKGSGLIFKDTLTIESFDDPKVLGVTLYITNFQRPITERITKNFFADPSSASVGCAKTGKVKIANNIATGMSGEEVFEESRSMLFKSLRVQRIYDQEKNTVVYVSFSTRLDKNSDENKSRFKSSICAVNLND